MSELARYSPLDPSRLRGADYVESLLAEAERAGALPEAELARIRLEFGLLVARQTQRWTRGRSSSVRVEAAQALLDGCLYTVGLALKELPGPDAALSALAAGDLTALYERGRRRVGVKLKVVRQLGRTAARGLLDVDVEVYRATLVDGVAGFFKLYDPDFAPQDIRITCDYPLYRPVEDLRGVEFLAAYLDAAVQEDRFCARFPLSAVRGLLCRSLGSYREQVFNIYEEVFNAALGCVLMGRDPAGLAVSAGEVSALQARLLVKDRAEVEDLVAGACGRLCGGMGLAGPVRRYVEAGADRLAGRVFHAVEGLCLRRVFAVE